MPTAMNKRLHQHLPNPQQKGVVMVVTLICLVVMLLASVALIRSTDANLLIAGHLSFKRDVINQAERAIPNIRTAFVTGTLSDASKREQSVAGENYSAVILDSNSVGIPTVLLNTSTFDGSYGGKNIVDSDSQITIRYVIDRISLQTGPCSVTSCAVTQAKNALGGDANNLLYNNTSRAQASDTPVYRISIRVTGPRNTEAFLQSTFSI
jgi:type IV pilus assembly protein PilX